MQVQIRKPKQSVYVFHPILLCESNLRPLGLASRELEFRDLKVDPR